jgi:hypothetical protein
VEKKQENYNAGEPLMELNKREISYAHDPARRKDNVESINVYNNVAL